MRGRGMADFFRLRGRGGQKRSIEVNSEEFIRAFGVYGSNISVKSPEQAFKLDVVYRCVDILSGTIASMPLYVRRKNGRVFEIMEDSSANDLFCGAANERQTFFELMRNAVFSYLLHGNAYIYPEWGGGGELERMYLLHPTTVNYDVNRNVYHVLDPINGMQTTYAASELIHLRNKSLDGGYVGVSTIAYASRTLSLAANADEQTLDGLRRGNKQRGFLSGGNVVGGMGSLQDAAIDDVAKRLEKELSEDRAIIRMPGTVTFSPIDIKPVDAQLLENRMFSPYSICRFFGVHPDMVFVSQNSNYKASENSQTTFLTQTLSPLLNQIESEFFVKLIKGSRAVKRKYRVKYDISSIYKADPKTRAEYIKMQIESGVLTPNEARMLEDRRPMYGGDDLFISCNVAPIGSAKIRGEKAPENGTNHSEKQTNNK